MKNVELWAWRGIVLLISVGGVASLLLLLTDWSWAFVIPVSLMFAALAGWLAYIRPQKKTNPEGYRIEIWWVNEEEGDGYYIAFHPEFGFSACSVPGYSRVEAIERLDQVREAVIQHRREKGKTIPKPEHYQENCDEKG
jgi:predicted RNase H-like HicB family nuclease